MASLFTSLPPTPPSTVAASQPLTWSDKFIYTLLNEASRGTEVKLTVSVLKNSDNEIKCTLTHLRRYKNGKPTKEGMTLKTEDLKNIEQYYNRFPRDTTSFKVSKIGNGERIMLEKPSNGVTKSIELRWSTWMNVQRWAPTLRYIVSGLCQKNKHKLAMEGIIAYLSDEISELDRVGSRSGCWKQDIENVTPQILKKMEGFERALEIPNEITRIVCGDPDLEISFDQFQKEEVDEEEKLGMWYISLNEVKDM